MATDRAVSEVVGFILVFSLILSTITFVYVGGFSGLQDARDHEQLANAERAFDVLSTNLESIASDEAPSRATEIKLSDAQLSVGDRRTVSTFNNSTDVQTSRINRSRAIVYSAQSNSRVVYEHGAIIRVDGDSSVMIDEPDFVIGDERTVIRHVELVGDSQGVGGDTTALVRARKTSSDVLYANDPASDVTLQFNTTAARAPAWHRYLQSEIPGDTGCDTILNGDVAAVKCTYSTDSLYVATVRIHVEFA